ncbi:MAG: CGNR zinc finger domain-containing protein [Methylophaga sp.]|uniref:CGNR zinc finger domain-containing protein n=1 Tax=Methylophaga sp. TaxID=2024840 RepID=UPI00299E9393|nr:CGNR zinc finger domain-containing protein [Methylophaga sp.]MDX1751304.1 CGNR zinc finger domain-containing protein [Methylophaga sp.]
MNKIKHNYEFVGNNLGVDFINTEVNVKGELVNLLLSESDVMEWLEQANIDADLAQGIDVGKLLAFREKARQILSQIIEKERIENDAIATLNNYLQNYKIHYQLEQSSEGYQLTNQTVCHSTADIIGVLAFELANMLASEQRAYLKRCLNPDCVLMFVDNSRSHKRRWCSMETCGNRAKVSKHYRKVKS